MSTKTLEGAVEATKHAGTLMKSKLAKGYVEIN
jgi:hypothetical protein